MADKAIYSVDTVTSMSGTDMVYVNTGNNIKQITKDNLCGNDIKGIKANLSDYGLNNVFDGEFIQGGMDSGTIVVKDDYVITKNKIYCSSGDFIKSFGNSLESSYACFYKSDNTYIGGLNALDGCTAPSDSAYCYVEFKRSGITPSTAGHIGVCINNQIDVVKNSIQSGQNFSSTSSGTVTFPIPYKSIPNVVCTIIAPISNTNSVIIKITNITEKKFDYITVKDNELNNDNTIQWISMGEL